MKKVELLSPVGNIEMLKSAIHNGADAVYLSGKLYGARKFANNFDYEQLEYAVKYSHLYGVKVYVTVNTLIYESELDKVIEYLIYLHKLGVDAIIMQDIGLIRKVRYILPNLEIHASTQCHNHNEYGIKALKDLGVTRVVMAREMSLNEINNIKVDIEKEVFIYGALCVCYSGCCLFSSLNGKRSGNRGECVGCCRLPYKLLENDKELDLDEEYLLSTKELNTTNNLKEILDSNIDCLKIEGRMKSPSYVGYVTRIYRTLIDKYYNKEDMTISTKELNNLKKLYNREFTKGYLFNDISIMNRKSPNHIGIPIGRVIKYTKDLIYIELDKDNLSQNDGIRFKNSNKGMIINKLYNNKLLLVNNILKGNIAILDNKLNINSKDIILKTIDYNLEQDILKYQEKKININYKVDAIINERLKITISDNLHEYTEYGNIITKSLTKEVTRNDIIEKLSKLGNTPFILDKIDINKSNNIFISLSELNNIRRNLTNKLISLRESTTNNIIINEYKEYIYKNNSNKYNINVLVRNKEQLDICLKNDIDNIYITDYNLYKEYKNIYNNLYYRTERVSNNIDNYTNDKLLVSELGAVNKYNKDNYLVSDYYLNITNTSSIEYLDKLNIKRITLSVELEENEIKNIMNKNNYNVELIIYGRLELMVMKYCPLKELINNCTICKNNKNKYYLLSKDHKKYPIMHNNCYTHIMHYEELNKISRIDKYKKMNIYNYRIELFEENSNEVDKIIKEVKKYLYK